MCHTDSDCPRDAPHCAQDGICTGEPVDTTVPS
jgi:hypothetical protein